MIATPTNPEAAELLVQARQHADASQATAEPPETVPKSAGHTKSVGVDRPWNSTSIKELNLIGTTAEALLAEAASIKHRAESLFSALQTDLVAITVLEDLNHCSDRMEKQLFEVCRAVNSLERRHGKRTSKVAA